MNFDITQAKNNLTSKAALTAASQGFLHLVKGLIVLVLTPITLGYLGPVLFGLWSILQQILTYLSFSDLRTAGTLKYQLSLLQTSPDKTQKNKLISCALLFWLMSFPLFLILGVMACYYLPSYFVLNSATSKSHFQNTLIILLIASFVERLSAIPAAIIRGHNLDFFRFRQQLFLTLLAAGLSYLALLLGFQLVGLALALLVINIFYCIFYYRLVVRIFSELKLLMPSRVDLRNYFSITIDFFQANLFYLFLTSSELLIVGLIWGPKIAASYALTLTYFRLFTLPISQLISSSGPGLNSFATNFDSHRVLVARRDAFITALTLLTVFGSVSIFVCQGFINIWLGPEYYLGSFCSFLIFGSQAIQILTRFELLLLDLRQQYKFKKYLFALVGLIFLGFILFLSEQSPLYIFPLGSVVCLGLLAILVQSSNSKALTQKLEAKQKVSIFFYFYCSLLILLAYVFQPNINSLTELGIAGLVVFVLYLIVIPFSFPSREREILIARVRGLF